MFVCATARIVSGVVTNDDTSHVHEDGVVEYRIEIPPHGSGRGAGGLRGRLARGVRRRGPADGNLGQGGRSGARVHRLRPATAEHAVHMREKGRDGESENRIQT